MNPLRFALFALTLSACGVSPIATATAAESAIPPTDSPPPTFTFTPAPTDTLVPTAVFTLTIAPTVTITPTPTFAFPAVTVNKQAHCRYGPSVAYLHAADLYPGDVGSVRQRFLYSKWLYVKFDKLNYFCWVAPSVVDVVGDVSALEYKELNLQSIGSNRYGPPQNVYAVRNGDKVVIYWDQVVMTQDDDRGYLLELFVCQNGAYIWWTDSYPDQFQTSYAVKDEAGCRAPSSGKLYTVEKHGFSEAAIIRWPPP
ncbi:MAG: hypothetical protein OZ914_11330 [Anaerolineaceae bacterium]|jgi:hypothetical protein|nr:hypothetical protein [Anaerolineaceae bacterium]OQY90596.1 MAG: hypothetical protein B6D38_02385 [Anaerolineae bacterium UTCFX1]